MNAYSLEDTIVAIATPPGVGAIGVLRLSGNDAIKITDEIFFGKKLSKQPSHTIHYGKIKDGETILDEVVVSLFIGPASYTKENVTEISCHGSPYILQKVLELCIRKGARLAKPGEYTMRAFLNGGMDLSQAEAVADLIASDSASNHQSAMRQMRGGFSAEISQLRKALIKFASLIELELDFGEEDVEFADRSALIDLVAQSRGRMEELLASFSLGNVIKNGVNTVIAGRPNAGKSTLLNALLNEERAIVSDIAGTTRDVIEAVINIKGIPFRLMDTAGIRAATDAIESVGVEKAKEKISISSLVIYVFDLAELGWKDVLNDINELGIAAIPHLIIGNKIDLLEAKALHEIRSLGAETFGPKFQVIQANLKTNIGAIREQLYQLIVSDEIAKDQTVITNARHYETLLRAKEALDKVNEGLSSGISGDLVALDIRSALHVLGEITGEITTDDLLDSIFRDFCIGK